MWPTGLLPGRRANGGDNGHERVGECIFIFYSYSYYCFFNIRLVLTFYFSKNGSKKEARTGAENSGEKGFRKYWKEAQDAPPRRYGGQHSQEAQTYQPHSANAPPQPQTWIFGKHWQHHLQH